MADTPSNPHQTKPGGPSTPVPAPAGVEVVTNVGPSSWKSAWQLPALVLGLGLLAGALVYRAGQRTGPDFAGAVSSVEQLIEQAEYEKALELLNDPIGKNLSDPLATEAIHEKFYLLSADALCYAQKAKGLNVPANHEQVVELYQTARRRFHSTLDGRRTVNLADALVSLGRVSDAMPEIKLIPDSLAGERRALLRRLVDRRLAEQPGSADEGLMDLLSRFRDDPSATPADRAWAVAKQTRLRLDAGFPEESIRRLLPEIQRLDTRLGPEAGELLMLLGRAYFETGNTAGAREQLERAEQALPESSESVAEAKVLLGRIAQSHSLLDEAKEAFTLVTTRFEKSQVATRAWLGLGEVEADLGDEERSTAAYTRAVEAVRSAWMKRAEAKGEDASEARAATAHARLVGEIDASLGQRHRDRLLKGEFAAAQRYAQLAERLHPADKAPPAVPLRLAETERAAAEAMVPASAREPGEPPDLSLIDPVSREEAKRHFYQAALAFSRHAKAALISDPEASADSLWNAADCYDQAGEQDRAVDVFRQFIESRPDGPRSLLARYRLARALQSMGQYAKAISLFEDIVDSAPVSDEASMSLIPLAQCYLLASGDSDHSKAEARLLQIVEGRQFEPSAKQFRAAVVELGRMYRRIGEYPKAIERLSEAVTRYPDLGNDAGIQSNLADSYRLSAGVIGEQLKSAMPQNERVRLMRLRKDRLVEALKLYDHVRELLDQRDPRRMSELERLTLRNALFYRGDCAYDLGEFHKDDPRVAAGYFQQAVRFYDTAAQRYADDPSSLAAMMQIVSAYAALGRWTEAQTAQNRAKARLKELPDSAWDQSGGPMDRAHWERWLDSSVKLDRLALGEQRPEDPSAP